MTAPSQPWTIPQFEEHLSRYMKASRRRYHVIGILLVGQIALVFGILGGAGVASIHLSPAVLYAVMAEFLTGIVALAVGIVITSNAFVRRFAIHCEQCGASQHYYPYEALVASSDPERDLLEDALITGSDRALLLVKRDKYCRKCHALIAR
jgi:hypothetical protein